MRHHQGNNTLRMNMVASFLCFVCVAKTFAHVAPESEFGHHVQLRISQNQVIVDYAVVHSDLSLAQAFLEMETDGVPGVSDAERKVYDDRQRELLRQNLEFRADGQLVPLNDYFEEARETPERVFVYKFSAPIKVPEDGWVRDISIYNNIKLSSDEWLVYYVGPDHGIRMVDGDRWQKPEDEGETNARQGTRGVKLTYRLGKRARTEQLDVGQLGATNKETEGEKLKNVIRRPLDLKFVIVALIVSAVFGGLHALTSQHGKVVVAAYLVGSKGRVRDAVFLGLVVTFTHTFSVIALGLVTLFASEYILPQGIAPWLNIASGFLIAVLGTWLLGRNLRQYRSRQLTHSHAPDHHHDRSLDVHAQAHEHDHHEHSHPHSHAPEPPGFRGLLSLGVAGGIVPCVDALVGLLFAISINRIGWGLVVLCAFSIGLASALVAVGVLIVLAKPAIDGFTGEGVWLQRLQILSSAVVIVLGTILMFRALFAIGLISIQL